MKWFLVFGLLVASATAIKADELHMRDGSVIVGVYIGGTQKEVYFQRTPTGTDIFPLFMVESVKFNSVPGLPPSASAPPHPGGVNAPSPTKASLPSRLAAQLKWALALLFPPPLTAQFAHPAH